MSRRKIPPCLAGMGCLCCGHARGAPPSLPCSTDEDAPYYRRGRIVKAPTANRFDRWNLED